MLRPALNLSDINELSFCREVLLSVETLQETVDAVAACLACILP